MNIIEKTHLLVLMVHHVLAMNYYYFEALMVAMNCHVNQWLVQRVPWLPHVVHRSLNPTCCRTIWPRDPDDISHCQCVPANNNNKKKTTKN